VLTGAYALGPEAGEWLQQATLAILRDTIQPFPTFSEAFLHALTELGAGDPSLSEPGPRDPRLTVLDSRSARGAPICRLKSAPASGLIAGAGPLEEGGPPARCP
jgi:hypothetical protein